MNQADKSYSRLDKALAQFLGSQTTLNTLDRTHFEKIVCELSSELAHGHSCIKLEEHDQALIKSSGIISDNPQSPLILERDRLYLHRYWQYETRLAEQLLQVAKSPLSIAADNTVLNRYFDPVSDSTDWQREAARTAITQSLCIITGGPGTGKTTTVVKILAILQEITTLTEDPLHIALAAPTGKAAMRLQESINQSKIQLPCSEAIKTIIPETVSTLHRLLKVIPASPYFQHNASNPLPYDLVVIDEASMIDLALMSKLVDALKPGARLILLGDKDQLASVESGAVLADLTSALPDNTLELKKTHRFDMHIKMLADAVNQQLAEQAWQILITEKPSTGQLHGDLITYASKQMAGWIEKVTSGADFKTIYQSFNDFQILCATRQGKNSVTDINSRVEQQLASQGLINPNGTWYSGRPIMITQNDPGMHLFNGDIGICLADAEQQGKLTVFFERSDGSIKKFLPSRLPHCETVYAMTIHKSQGSEFQEVLIVLPETINPILTKELIYTGITRAKNTVKLVTEKEVFISTVKQRVIRYSGLRRKLERH